MKEDDVEAPRQVLDGAERHLSLFLHFINSKYPDLQVCFCSALPFFFVQERIFSEALGPPFMPAFWHIHALNC